MYIISFIKKQPPELKKCNSAKDKNLVFIYFLIIFCFVTLTPALISGQDLRTTEKKVEMLLSQPQKIKHNESLLDSLLTGIRKIQTDSIAKSEEYAIRSLGLMREIKYKRGIAYLCYRLGIIYKNLERYVDSYDMLNEANNLFRKINDKKGLATSYNGMGNLFLDLNNPEQALTFFNKSLSLFEEMNDDRRKSEINLNIGAIYMKYDTIRAKTHFLQLIEYFSNKKEYNNLVPSFLNLGEVFESLKKPDSAFIYYRQGMQLSEISGDKSEMMNSYQAMGRFYSMINKTDSSNYFLLKALETANEFDYKQDVANISKLLAGNYSSKGNFSEAYYYLSKKEALEDKINTQEATKIIAKTDLDKINRISRTRTKMFDLSLIILLIAVLLIIAVYRNYRIKQKANRLLTEMDELKSRLFSNITHEFRTPLTLILSPLEEMLTAGERKSPNRSEIEMMRRNANRLLNLINQMLDLAKLDAQSLKIELTEADFFHFMRIRLYSFASLAEKKHIRFSASVSDGTHVTFFDHDKLEKIINNLLSNAFKFTDNGGEIVCGLTIVNRKKEIAEIFVSDTGKGIPEGHLKKIFDRFHQVDGPEGSNAYGTGIGLSLTRELISLMHGEIRVESELGKGTRFTVTLPLGKNHLDKDEYVLIKYSEPDFSKLSEKAGLDLAAEESPGDIGSDKKTAEDLPIVLIVEDQKEIREYIKDYLKDSFRVLEAENGKKGLQAAVKNIPDLVITDLMMPEMNGVELCRKLKSDERISHIPVIMLTAKASIEERMKGIETGADAYLTKPFNIQELKLVARKLIEQRKKLRERFGRDVKLEPKDIAITPADEKFLNRALAVIETYMGDSDFEVNTFQKEMAMSRMQLFRKIKALSDQTPSEFIRTIRLKRAGKLIEQGFGNIAEITYEVGFNNPSYFAKCFKDLYGCLPSDYLKEQNKD